MVSLFSVTLPSGADWTPEFVDTLDIDACVGCGRCFKVCQRGVFLLRAIDEDGAFVDEEDEEDGEYERKVMTIADPDNCIGCRACAQVCTKHCFTHAPHELVA
jgi:Nif-specific ferredoxin III